jgi:hypothetical protein
MWDFTLFSSLFFLVSLSVLQRAAVMVERCVWRLFC